MLPKTYCQNQESSYDCYLKPGNVGHCLGSSPEEPSSSFQVTSLSSCSCCSYGLVMVWDSAIIAMGWLTLQHTGACDYVSWLAGGFNFFFVFSPQKLGKIFTPKTTLQKIFPMGWFNSTFRWVGPQWLEVGDFSEGVEIKPQNHRLRAPTGKGLYIFPIIHIQGRAVIDLGRVKEIDLLWTLFEAFLEFKDTQWSMFLAADFLGKTTPFLFSTRKSNTVETSSESNLN